jgi:hypothetical protein
MQFIRTTRLIIIRYIIYYKNHEAYYKMGNTTIKSSLMRWNWGWRWTIVCVYKCSKIFFGALNEFIQRLLQFQSLLINFTTLLLFHRKEQFKQRVKPGQSRGVADLYVNWISSKTRLVYHDHFVIFSLRLTHSFVNTGFRLYVFEIILKYGEGLFVKNNKPLYKYL